MTEVYEFKVRHEGQLRDWETIPVEFSMESNCPFEVAKGAMRGTASEVRYNRKNSLQGFYVRSKIQTGPQPEKSQGHIMFALGMEFYLRNDNLYIARHYLPVMPDGFRCGRFETDKRMAGYAIASKLGSVVCMSVTLGATWMSGPVVTTSLPFITSTLSEFYARNRVSPNEMKGGVIYDEFMGEVGMADVFSGDVNIGGIEISAELLNSIRKDYQL